MFDGASNYAESVDFAMLVIVGISVILLVGIIIAMIYFVIRYSRKRNPVATQIHGNVVLEVIWIIIPTILVMVMFWYGYKDFREMRDTLDYAMKVQVTGFMWDWEFDYENGGRTDTLYIPVNRVTRLELISRDVVHSFYIPAFRLKEDLVAGSFHYMILEPKKTGTFDVACAEYCGRDHSAMYTAVVVMPEEEFDSWYASIGSGGSPDVAAKESDTDDIAQANDGDGGEITEEAIRNALKNHPKADLLSKKGCIACHSTDGSKKIGPSFLELGHGYVNVDKDGKMEKVKIDADYIRRSILDPNAEVVEGYSKYMMPEQGSMLSDEELEAIIEILTGKAG